MGLPTRSYCHEGSQPTSPTYRGKDYLSSYTNWKYSRFDRNYSSTHIDGINPILLIVVCGERLIDDSDVETIIVFN